MREQQYWHVRVTYKFFFQKFEISELNLTVKTFPLPDQVEIKRKLFEILNSVESRIATETTARNYYERSQQLLSSESQEYEYSLLHIS
jgi:hypothetical protein